MNPESIRPMYLKSWFVPDLLSCFPVDSITIIIEHTLAGIADPDLSVRIAIVRLFRVLRLLRVARLAKYIADLEKLTDLDLVISELHVRISSMCGFIILILHWNACIQFAVTQVHLHPDHCWISTEHLQHEHKFHQYSFSIFRALSQMITIGYGSVNPPIAIEDMWMVMLSFTSGSLIYSNVLAQLSAMASNAQQAITMYRQKTSLVKEYMAYRKLPKELSRRILDYYETRYQGKWFDEPYIINQMSEPLKEEVMAHLCFRLVRKAPFFQECDVNILTEVIKNLQSEMFQAGDIIFMEGAFGNKMYFIEYGEVQVETHFFKKKLVDGNYFGEIALLKRSPRTATVRALTLCNLFSLCTERFQEVCDAYPEMRQVIMETAADRLETLREVAASTKQEHEKGNDEEAADSSKPEQTKKESRVTKETTFQ